MLAAFPHHLCMAHNGDTMPLPLRVASEPLPVANQLTNRPADQIAIWALPDVGRFERPVCFHFFPSSAVALMSTPFCSWVFSYCSVFLGRKLPVVSPEAFKYCHTRILRSTRTPPLAIFCLSLGSSLRFLPYLKNIISFKL